MADRKLRKSGVKVIIGYFLGPFIQGTILFVSAGHINIPWVWVYLIVSFVGMFGGIVVVSIVNPELVNQRDWKKKKDTKPWDKFLMPAHGLMAFYVMPVIVGLDVGRFQWSNLGINFAIGGCLLFILGSVFINWAMLVNTHFEATVRIQADRGHKVVTDGPYRVVRHPGYVGVILWVLSTPAILGRL